jgi:hypothetical protein
MFYKLTPAQIEALKEETKLMETCKHNVSTALEAAAKEVATAIDFSNSILKFYFNLSNEKIEDPGQMKTVIEAYESSKRTMDKLRDLEAQLKMETLTARLQIALVKKWQKELDQPVPNAEDLLAEIGFGKSSKNN